MGKNDTAWEVLFNRHDILNKVNTEGQFIITADEIKEEREPRLMTKFDHRANLPELFSANNLSILPLTRGSYVISRFDAYHDFEEIDTVVKKYSIPSYLQTLKPKYITSEAIALNCANVCGILEDFIGDSNVVETINGRMKSGNFDFDINTDIGIRNVSVSNSQIEIDGAYEGNDTLSIFEAKSDLSDDFLVRQLYYPYRRWKDDISKKCIPIFLIYTNGTYYLYQYEFTDEQRYDSISLVKQGIYELTTGITTKTIVNLIKESDTVQEPDIPFPQADIMERVVNLLELLDVDSMSKEQIRTTYDFDKRQVDYYTNAGIYLGLFKKGRRNDETIVELSDEGMRIVGLSFEERNIEIIKKIIQHKVFRDVLFLQVVNNKPIDKDTVIGIMKKNNLYHVDSEATYKRRASTVIGWCNWILNLASK